LPIAGEYPNEDTMPNRMGMTHVRGLPLKEEQFGKSESGVPLVSKSFVENFIAGFNDRLSSTLFKNASLSNDELEKLGKKDAEKAVEEFINANCVELAKDKWLCPLSGKKFKGPEFIQKHLHSKHEDKLNEIRDEVIYYNNYLMDPNRPHNVEPKLATTSSPQLNFSPAQAGIGQDDQRRIPDHDNRNMHRNWSNNDRGGGNTRYQGPIGGGRVFGSGGNRDFNKPRFFDPTSDGGRRDPRQQVAYRDLDQPEEIF